MGYALRGAQREPPQKRARLASASSMVFPSFALSPAAARAGGSAKASGCGQLLADYGAAVVPAASRFVST